MSHCHFMTSISSNQADQHFCLHMYRNLEKIALWYEPFLTYFLFTNLHFVKTKYQDFYLIIKFWVLTEENKSQKKAYKWLQIVCLIQYERAVCRKKIMLWAGFEMEKLEKRNVISSCSETETEPFNLWLFLFKERCMIKFPW